MAGNRRAGPGGCAHAWRPTRRDREMVRGTSRKPGMMFVQFLLTVAITAILFYSGEEVAGGVGVLRTAGLPASGRGYGHSCGQDDPRRCPGLFSPRSSNRAWRGSAFCDRCTGPFFLAAIIFILALAQHCPLLVMVPAVIWCIERGSGLGDWLLVWTIFRRDH